MNLLISVAVLALQRVPFVNQIPAIRDAGTIDRAITGLNKAVARLEDVAANHTAAADAKAAAIKVLQEEHSAALAVAARAKRVAGKVADLVA
jgi:hypothetical protein